MSALAKTLVGIIIQLLHMPKELYVQQLELGSMANFSYLIGDTSNGEAAVIDPNDDTAAIEAAAASAGLKVSSVLLTHGHYDHTGGLAYYCGKLGLPAYLSNSEFMLYIPRCNTLKRIADHEKIPLGQFTIDCLHTPGHTPGCICFLVNGNLFTGDTLFVEAIGRTDLPGGNAATLFKSLQTIKHLPNNTIVWPGHNYGSTTSAPLGILKTSNPFLVSSTVDDFLDLTG